MNLYASLLISLFSFFLLPSSHQIEKADQDLQIDTLFNEDLPPFSNCPASPYPTIINQPNNTTITIIGKGNMVNNWTETIDGYTVVLKNGIYEYANKVSGDLLASGVPAHDPIDRTPTEISYVSTLPKSAKPNLSPLNQSILNQVRNRVTGKTFPSSGNIKVLALLIDYPNLTSTYSKSNFDSLLYAANYRNGDGSFKYFYETSSDSILTIDVDVHGWFRATNNYLYYSRDSGYDRAADLVREAVDAAEVAGVNFANYDNDNDGDVDGILAVHSGPGAEQGSRTQYIWSHRWVLNGGNLGSVIYDGKFINDYMINPETRISGASQNLVGIGVFCHEFGHNLGLPDLYDTDNSNGDSEGIGNWCLMAGGGWLGGEHRPVNHSAWCRVELNWATPTTLTIGTSSSHTMQPSVNAPNEIYRINSTVGNEYYLLENRQKTGLDLELPGEGLAVWHINTNKTQAPGNSVNADENLKGVDLEEADGNNDLDNEVNRGDNGDLYPGSSTNRTFNDNSNPNSRTYTNAVTGLQLRNITENGNLVSFDFGPPPLVTCSGTTTLTASSSVFDDGSGTSSPYANNLNCSWLIQPSSGPINLSFTRFDLDALGDTLYLYDGANSSASLIGKYTGSTNPPAAVSSGNSLYIEFITNGLPNSLGWEVSYTSSAPATTCSGNTTLSGTSGTFDDGSGPTADYDPNLNCSWQIDGTLSTMLLTIDSLDIESVNDSLIIYEGQNNLAPVAAIITNNNQATTLNLNSRFAFVEFKTNATISAAGWQISWLGRNGCSGIDTLSSPTGTFSDGTLPNANYADFSNCQWLIAPAGASSIDLSFNRFALENNFDFVEVFDGPTTASPRIGNFSGNTIPATLTSSGGSMLVRFTSDLSINFTGFEASYTSSSVQCLGTRTLTANSGSFSDGSGSANYGPNLNCGWLIQPIFNDTIKIDFSNFDTESGNDLVNIYNGVNNSGSLVASYSGNSIPPQTVVSGSGISVFVEFITNGTIGAAGWDATYTSSSATTCSGTTTLTAANGSFDDGSGNQNYDDNLNCSWLIQPSGNPAVISLDFNSMNLANFNDFVRIYDGTSTAGQFLGTLRFNNTGPTFTAFSGSMFIQFSTDATNNAAGWDATYTSSSSFCNPNTTLTAPFGIVDDGSPIGTPYQNNTSCQWLIQPPVTNQAIRFVFFRLITQPGVDTVTIYDGSSTTDPILGTFSGNAIPNPIISSGPNMLVTFNTDGSVAADGWRGSYQTIPIPTCSGQTNLTAASGTFDDGSGTSSNYSDNLLCSWLIQPPGAITIDLNFNNFDTESNFDFVRVYDGTNNSSTLLGSFSGSTIPPSLRATSGSMFVEFDSDASVNAAGWEATYTSSNTINLTASPDTIILNAALGSQSPFSVSSNTSWNVTDNSAWMLTNPVNGNLNQNVNVIAIQPNIGPERFGEVYVTDLANITSDTVIVRQLSSGRFLVAQPDTLFYQGTPAGSQNALLQSNVNWTLSSPFSWITIGTTNGTNNGSIAISVSTNSGSDRIGYVIASGNFGVSNDTIFVRQGASGPTLSVSPSTITLAQAMGSNSNFNVISNVNWQTSTPASWLSIQNPAVTSGNNTVGISATSMNGGASSRSSFVAVQDVAGNLFDTVFVTQLGGNLFLTAAPDTLFLGSLLGSTGQITLNTNTQWNGGPAIPDFTLSQFSGTGNATITVTTTTENYTPFPLISYAAFSATGGNPTDTVILVQEPIVPALAIRPRLVNLDQMAMSRDTAYLFSNTEWEIENISPLPAFFGTSATSGIKDDTIFVIAATANTNPNTRSGFVAYRDRFNNVFDTLFINQTGTNPILQANQDTVFLNGRVGSTTIVTFLSNGAWTAIEGDPWFRSNINANSGNGKLTLTANSSNPGTNPRVSFLALEDVGQMLTDTVIVIQDTIFQTLNALPDTVVLSSNAGAIGTINLFSTVNWTAAPLAAWFNISQSSGSTDATITVNSNSANPNFTDRFSAVVFTDATDPLNTDTVVIQQEGAPIQLRVNPLAVNLNFTSGSFDVLTVNSNTSWTVNNPVSWLGLSTSSGNGNLNLTITANSDNLSGSSRLASLTFSAAGVPDVIVTVQQIDGSNPAFLFSRDTVFVDFIQGSTGDFSVLANQANWTLSESTPWLLVNPTFGSNTSSITVLAASRNAFGNFRYGTVVGTASGFPNDTLVVAQRPSTPLFQAAPSMINLGSDSSNTAFFNISSNLISWTLEENSSWMEVSPDSGSFTQRIEVAATEDNNSGAVRSGMIQIISPPQVPLIVMVNQDTVRSIGLNENREVLDASLKVYPNPARDLIVIEGNGLERLELDQMQLYSASGRLVSTHYTRRSATQIEIDLSSEAAGIYYLRYQHDDGVLSKKIILLD
jgi:M6 family metalloprotease-like protein